jgi:hypothetical protein
MTMVDPIRCWAIRATASPTVVDGLTVCSIVLMTSRTVGTPRFYAATGPMGT